MKKLIVAACAAVLFGAPMALAAATTSTGTSTPKVQGNKVVDTHLSSQCTTLSQQFSQAEAAHKTDKNYKEALALHNEGNMLCNSRNQAAGVKYLHSANKMIGVGN